MPHQLQSFPEMIGDARRFFVTRSVCRLSPQPFGHLPWHFNVVVEAWSTRWPVTTTAAASMVGLTPKLCSSSLDASSVRFLRLACAAARSLDMVHHLDLLLLCPDFPIFLLVLGGQHPSCVGLAKNKKKQGIEKKQQGTSKQRQEIQEWGGGQQRRSQKLLALNTGYYFPHGRTILTKK
jgi:hypothetical protein